MIEQDPPEASCLQKKAEGSTPKNFAVPHPLRHFLYKVTDLVKPLGFRRRQVQMQNPLDIQRDALSASLDAIGGEPLAGSGFETEDPESGFSNTDEVGE